MPKKDIGTHGNEERDEGRDETVAGKSKSQQEREYAATMREFMENKRLLMEEVEMLGKSVDAPKSEEWDASSDGNDSGHIADVISEDGEDVSGAVIWSSSGRKFLLLSADGQPVSELEADKAAELISSKRIAFDGADEQAYFVAQMSSAGVDVDQDRIGISEDGSTGELLVSPENLIGNERHHMSGEHAGGNAEWTDEVDLSDPESTGPQRIEEIRNAQMGRTDEASRPHKTKKISGFKVYQTDNIMTFATVLVIVGFYILVLAFEHPSPAMTGLWSVMCVAAISAVLLPFTMSMETREHNIGGKFLLTGGLCLVFALMSAFLLGDVIATGKRAWSPDSSDQPGSHADGESDEGTVILNFEPSGDIVHLEMTGSQRKYPAVTIGDVLVTTSEAGQANSLIAEIGGKRYATQTLATIDGLGIAAFTVESSSITNPIKTATSLSIGQDVIIYSTAADGSVGVEGGTIRSTTFPVGTQGLPEASEVDKVFVDKSLMPGDIVMDSDGNLIGIAPDAGDSVVTGTSISKAVNVLMSNDNDLYVGIVCRQASISENEDGGAYVENVMTNSPASNAGIMTGDVIVSVDNRDVEGTDDLDALIEKHEPGEQVSLGIIRDGNKITLGVTIGHGKELPSSEKSADDKKTAKDGKEGKATPEPPAVKDDKEGRSSDKKPSE